MSSARVGFDRVWKKFAKGQRHDSLRDLLPAAIKAVARRDRGHELGAQEFWAVRDVSFEVRPGEALGIIGPNGAGKSTTLKLLTKIMRPTLGTAFVRGRVGALIEIAAGFHPDLTGRENVFLQGAILGMRRDAIARHLDEIVEFAGISAFIDTQVKRYSSGMNARLGFAIAAHLDPEVLIIDEVLSVGDMAFQQRCVERMMAFRREGVAIVFVSHNLQAVGMLCENSLLLERGEPLAIGPTEGVLETYLRAGQGVTTGGQTLTLTVGELETEEGAVASEVSPGMLLRLRIGYRVHAGFHDVTFGFVVYRSTDLLRVYDAHFFSRELGLTSAAAGDEFDLEFAFHAHLTRGHYHIECHVYDNPTQVFLARRSPAAHFAVHETRTWGGVANIDTRARLVGRFRRSEPPVLASPHEAG